MAKRITEQKDGFTVNLDQSEDYFEDKIPMPASEFKVPLMKGQALIPLNRQQRRLEKKKRRSEYFDEALKEFVPGERHQARQQARRNWENRRVLERERDKFEVDTQDA